jgi:hypothetical protein
MHPFLCLAFLFLALRLTLFGVCYCEHSFCHPLDTIALYKQDMTYVMSALKRSQEILLTLMDVFIKEPQLDWSVALATQSFALMIGLLLTAPRRFAVCCRVAAAKANAGRVTVPPVSGSSASVGSASLGSVASSAGASVASAASSSSYSGSSDNDVSRYTRDKIRIARRKLRGDNPAAIMVAELTSLLPPWRFVRLPPLGLLDSFLLCCVTDTKLVSAYPKAFQQCSVIVMAKPRIRGRNGWKPCVSVAEQVDFLIDMATDLNILGRTWGGWMPFC